MTPFEVTKSFISLYVDETKLGAVTFYEGRGTESVSRKALQAGKVVHRVELYVLMGQVQFNAQERQNVRIETTI